MATDTLVQFKDMIERHAKDINNVREDLAKRVSDVVAASGSEPLTAIDITVAMARIDTILDEFYGPEGKFVEVTRKNADRARRLAFDLSNDILAERLLPDHPELYEEFKQ